MHSFFVSGSQMKAAAAYALALALLVGGGSFVLRRSADRAAAANVSAGQTAQPTAEAIYHGDEQSSNISLAINVDWGGEYLPAMLDTLTAAGVHATFFITGRWCDNNPELTAQIAAAGHEIGNHGYSHASPNASTPQQITDEIRRTEESIRTAAGVTTVLYAPPSGECEQHVTETAAAAGYYSILWSVDTIDWQLPDADTIIGRVKKKIDGGGIILAHPTAPTAEALPRLITELQAEGYSFVTVSENIGL